MIETPLEGNPKRDIVLHSIDCLIDKVTQDWHDRDDYVILQDFANQIDDAFKAYDTCTEELRYNFWYYLEEGCSMLMDKLGLQDIGFNYRHGAAILHTIESHKLNKNQVLELFRLSKTVTDWFEEDLKGYIKSQ